MGSLPNSRSECVPLGHCATEELELRADLHRQSAPLWRRMLPLVGLLLLAALLSRLELAPMAKAATRIGPGFLFVAVACFSLNLGVKAWRWYRIVVYQGVQVNPTAAFISFAEGAFYGAVTFGRVGEISRALMLRQRGVDAKRGIAVALVDRLMDVSALGLVVAVLALWLLQNTWLTLVCLAFCVLILATAAILVRMRHKLFLSLRRENSVVWKLGGQSAAALLAVLGNVLRPYAYPTAMLEFAVTTCVSWTLYFATTWILAVGMQLYVSRSLLAVSQGLAALTSILPFTYQGVGLREGIFAATLSREGATAEDAVVLGLLSLATMLGTTLAWGAVGLATVHIQNSRRRQTDLAAMETSRKPGAQ